MSTYTPRLRAAAAYIQTHGWTQGTEQDGDGKVCLTGALRLCAPVDGDLYLIREVLRHKGHGESWNDAVSTSKEQVVKYLETTDVTDADLADTFGAQWVAIVALVRRSASLTDAEAIDLAASWAAARAAGAVSWDAARNEGAAAWDDARDDAREAAGAAAWAAGAAARAAGAVSWAAARDAAMALCVRDLMTPAQYATLTGPWANVIGKVHPDDEEVLG